jgi:hypothetical protein
MRAISVAILASALILMLCCVANRSSFVSLYEPRYPPSNFRQGPLQYSPYSLTGGLPPVYSAADVEERNAWTGYNFFQPVFSAQSYSPAAVVPMPLASATSSSRQRRPIEISSRFYVPVLISALKRSSREIKSLQQQLSHLQNVVLNSLKQPAPHAQLILHNKRVRNLGELSAWVLQLQTRIAMLEANHVSDAAAALSTPGPAAPRGSNVVEVRQGLPRPRHHVVHTGDRNRSVSRGPPLTADESRLILDAIAEMKQVANQHHLRLPNLGSSPSMAPFKKQAHKLLVHHRHTTSNVLPGSDSGKKIGERRVAVSNGRQDSAAVTRSAADSREIHDALAITIDPDVMR